MTRPRTSNAWTLDASGGATKDAQPPSKSRSGLGWARRFCALSVLIVLAFAARRVVVDFPALGIRVPVSAEDASYASHRLLAYAHIAPGAIYLIGGAAQLSSRIRTRHYTFHRRLGRLVLVSGCTSGVFAIAYGVQHPFGGPVEGAAALCFGIWFEACLITALCRIRRRDVQGHRRWMTRAYAIGSAVGTIRLLVAPLTIPLGFETAFATAFWIALTAHSLAAELYLRRAPTPSG